MASYKRDKATTKQQQEQTHHNNHRLHHNNISGEDLGEDQDSLDIKPPQMKIMSTKTNYHRDGGLGAYRRRSNTKSEISSRKYNSNNINNHNRGDSDERQNDERFERKRDWRFEEGNTSRNPPKIERRDGHGSASSSSSSHRKYYKYHHEENVNSRQDEYYGHNHYHYKQHYEHETPPPAGASSSSNYGRSNNNNNNNRSLDDYDDMINDKQMLDIDNKRNKHRKIRVNDIKDKLPDEQIEHDLRSRLLSKRHQYMKTADYHHNQRGEKVQHQEYQQLQEQQNESPDDHNNILELQRERILLRNLLKGTYKNNVNNNIDDDDDDDNDDDVDHIHIDDDHEEVLSDGKEKLKREKRLANNKSHVIDALSPAAVAASLTAGIKDLTTTTTTTTTTTIKNNGHYDLAESLSDMETDDANNGGSKLKKPKKQKKKKKKKRQRDNENDDDDDDNIDDNGAAVVLSDDSHDAAPVTIISSSGSGSESAMANNDNNNTNGTYSTPNKNKHKHKKHSHDRQSRKANRKHEKEEDLRTSLTACDNESKTSSSSSSCISPATNYHSRSSSASASRSRSSVDGERGTHSENEIDSSTEVENKSAKPNVNDSISNNVKQEDKTQKIDDESNLANESKPEQLVVDTRCDIIDADDNESLPNYFPGVQGCRSVEEFQCLNRIEEGTYGVVYRAKDKRTNEVVALKRLKMEKEKEGFPKTSLREINTLLKGQHPNIVTVREIVVGSNMDKIFIVMDYVEHDLKSLMETMKQRKQNFLPSEVKCLVAQLLRAVAHLHDNWILHRDLKTSNLLLSHKGILKVGDFGLAREYGSPLKRYTLLVVTLWYRAPELLLCAPEYSTPIDMWSVGCIFAELLLMRPLFTGESEIDQLNRIFKELGTPNEDIWKGFNELPAVKNLLSQNSQFTEFTSSNLRKRFGEGVSDLGIQLLHGMLTYDPSKRLTADAALRHSYFTELPLPIDPSMFPTWPAKSELGARKATEASPKAPGGGGKQLARKEETTNQHKSTNSVLPTNSKILSGIITGNKKSTASTGFVLNAGFEQRQYTARSGFNTKF